MKRVYDYDVVFITYNEPNGDRNWEHLMDHRFSDARVHRVHGVKGFDASIKRAAEVSQTDRFFVIDGDNVVQERFWVQEFETINEFVYSWSSRNFINGLICGNSGIKSWTKRLAEEMRTHEADPNGSTDFYWSVPYMKMNDWYSTNVNNCTPFQAFQAAFREGYKLCMMETGVAETIEELGPANIRRLQIWMSLGRDVPNGEWSMFGARVGFEYAHLGDNFTAIFSNLLNDYDGFEKLFQEELEYQIDEYLNQDYETAFADRWFPICDFEPSQSELVKSIMTNPIRRGMLITDMGEQDYLIRNNYRRDDADLKTSHPVSI